MSRHPHGLLDTNIIILRQWIPLEHLPDASSICTITIAELAVGVRRIDGTDANARAERTRRTNRLQQAESEFDPIPFGLDSAHAYGRINAAVRAMGRNPRGRTADLLIAAVATAYRLPLYTTNADDFAGLDALVEVVPVPRPEAADRRAG